MPKHEFNYKRNQVCTLILCTISHKINFYAELSCPNIKNERRYSTYRPGEKYRDGWDSFYKIGFYFFDSYTSEQVQTKSQNFEQKLLFFCLCITVFQKWGHFITKFEAVHKRRQLFLAIFDPSTPHIGKYQLFNVKIPMPI